MGGAAGPCFAGQGPIHLNSLGCEPVDSRETGPGRPSDPDNVNIRRRTTAGRAVLSLRDGTGLIGLAGATAAASVRWMTARGGAARWPARGLGIAGWPAGE